MLLGGGTHTRKEARPTRPTGPTRAFPRLKRFCAPIEAVDIATDSEVDALKELSSELS